MSTTWSDQELLDYIEMHSHSELALVANTHVRRFLGLAGQEMPQNLERVAFIGCRYPDIHELLERARQNLASRPSP